MVTLVEQRCRFLKPDCIGGVVTSRFEVVAVDRAPARDTTLVGFRTRLFNDVGQMVLDGEHAYLMRWRGAMATADRGNAA